MRRLAVDISNLLEKGQHLCDVKVVTSERCFEVHHDVLSMRSPGLHRLLQEGKGVVSLRPYSSEAVEWLLHFIYGDEKFPFPYHLLDTICELESILKVRGLAKYLRDKFGLSIDRKSKDSAFFDLSYRCGNVEICAGEGEQQQRFTGSSAILSARGSFFEALFSRKWTCKDSKRTKETKLRFDYVHPAVMNLLLDYAYTGALPERHVVQGRHGPVSFWLAALHFGYYFGMEPFVNECEWTIAQRHLSRANLATIWRSLPVVPQTGSRGILVDECVGYLEAHMGEFTEPCLRLDAELAQEGQPADDARALRKEAAYFYAIPKDLMKAALNSGRVTLDTIPLRKGLKLWARAHLEGLATEHKHKGFVVGDRVRFDGLKARPQLNGRLGIVQHEESGGRHVVRIPSSNRLARATYVRVRPSNLKRV
uniref:BTB domain-containing protein n=1 Tax=Lotharella globosa TaxID=91324 RepID=A0A7S3ZHD0_9EUKA